jgi:hypothetical protein
MMRLKVQDMTAESLSVARAERTNRNPLGILFKLLENLATEK